MLMAAAELMHAESDLDADPPPGVKRWLVSCDESGVDGSPYYGFGTLCMPWQRRGDFQRAVAELAGGLDDGTAIAADAQYLYWARKGGIERAPAEGGSVEHLADAASPEALAIDAGAVYWSDSAIDGGTLYRLPK